ncbi:hypothetical protein GOBAR_AA39299 [Gossypium barbadense]|uniref:Uncharacterized protein n=1 Tax=Gossypium barbadense TaxID=3634 RepID=A0A2P5VRH6_GOSBA|nr:hypothetical protein GOBAR_AA39299 [Gossypium barbadense]
MATDTTVTLKLLIGTKWQRLEAFGRVKKFYLLKPGKILSIFFNILSFLVGTVIWLLKKQEMVGFLGNLKDSFEIINDTYIQSTANKETLLKPIASINAANVPAPLLPTTKSSKSIEIYRIQNSYHRSSCGLYAEDDSKSVCLSYNEVMNQIPTVVNLQKKDSSTDEGGYVKGSESAWGENSQLEELQGDTQTEHKLQELELLLRDQQKNKKTSKDDYGETDHNTVPQESP